ARSRMPVAAPGGPIRRVDQSSCVTSFLHRASSDELVPGNLFAPADSIGAGGRMPTEAVSASELARLTDEEVVERVSRGETALFELLARDHDQPLDGTARAPVRAGGHAADVPQGARVRACPHRGP